jgi:hypothetical protein
MRRVITTKKLSTPIHVFLDEQSFIRKADGAYLFDMDGDIFKISTEEFRRLCAQHVLLNL